jgi:hypothetical protein
MTWRTPNPRRRHLSASTGNATRRRLVPGARPSAGATL